MSRIEFSGYEIDPETGIIYGRRGRPIRAVTANGYISVGRSRDHMYGHRMVWQAIHGPIPDGLQINHINGIKTDNRIANLELVTHTENAAHAMRTGLFDIARLTRADVLAIRADKHSSITALAEKYGVGRMTVWDAKSGKTWG